jgi:nitrite reductase/ring-hydroxylating ferredoxin subunit
LSWLADRKRRRALPLALETAGTATLCVGGWLGGTLAYRNQIGVDHRYANAGKWQEARIDGEKAAALEEVSRGLEMNQMKLVHVDGKRVAVGRTGKGYAAFQDRCTHKGGPLSDGVLMCGTVQCPWHGSQFDVHTGDVKAGPAEVKIETYDVHDQQKKIGA